MTSSPDKPDDAIVRALLGETDLHKRTTAMVDEVLALREQTEDLRRRAYHLLTEVALHEQDAVDRVRTLLASFQSAGTDDMIEGVGQLVAVLTGGESKLRTSMTATADSTMTDANGSARRPARGRSSTSCSRCMS